MDTQAIYADKIQKLLAKAESTTPQEAELLFAKAQELMAKYAIDEAMLASARKGETADNPYVEEEFPVVGIYRFALSQVVFIALKSAGLHVFQYGGKNPRTVAGRLYKETVVLVGCGLKSDVDRVRVLATSLMLQALRAENAWWEVKQHDFAFLDKKEQHYQRRQFLFSFAAGVQEKINAANIRARRSAEEEHGSGVALVLRDKALAVQEEFEQRHPDLKQSKSRTKAGGWDAHNSGKAAGRNADVGHSGVGGGRKAINS
jgi:hypothetical protein